MIDYEFVRLQLKKTDTTYQNVGFLFNLEQIP